MTETDTDPLVLEVAEGVATLTLDRAAGMNSLTTAAKVALRDTLHAVAADAEVRAVLLTGRGRAFCVGQDLREHAATLAAGDQRALWSTVPEHYAPIATALATMPKPVVAAVNGVAAGAGMSIALACDLRYVARSASFTTAFTGVGLSCDTGISWTLPRLIGQGRATDLLLRPRTVGAREALEIGLVTEVVDDDALQETALAAARSLAQGPTIAYASVKRSVAHAWTTDLAGALEQESRGMSLTGSTRDHAGAVAAFLGKQRPRFAGR